MERLTTHVRVSKRTKKEIDKYVQAHRPKIYLVDLVNEALLEYMRRHPAKGKI